MRLPIFNPAMNLEGIWKRSPCDLLLVSHYDNDDALAKFTMRASVDERADVCVMTSTRLEAMRLWSASGACANSKAFRNRFPHVSVDNNENLEDICYSMPLPADYRCFHGVANGCSERCRNVDVLFSNGYYPMADAMETPEYEMKMIYVILGEPTDAVIKLCADSVAYGARTLIIEKGATSDGAKKMERVFNIAGSSSGRAGDRWSWARRLRAIWCCV